MKIWGFRERERNRKGFWFGVLFIYVGNGLFYFLVRLILILILIFSVVWNLHTVGEGLGVQLLQQLEERSGGIVNFYF